MHRFEQAYECGDLHAYAQLFTMDFMFLSNDPRFLNEHIGERKAEVQSGYEEVAR